MTTNSWPARTIKECNEILTAKGSPFETKLGVIDGRLMTYYKNTPGPTLRQFWLNTKVHGNVDYVVYLEERYTYAETHAIVARTANILQREYGLVKGDRVALVLRNCPEWIFIFWACAVLGCAPVAINSWVSPEQMAHCISNSGASLLAVDHERRAEIQPFLGRFPELRGVMLVRHTSGLALKIPPWLRMGRFDDLQKRYQEYTEVPEAEIDQDDLCAIYYTSGTTGNPKGVPATSRMFMTGVVSGQIAAARAALRRGEDIPQFIPGPQKAMLMPAPLFHVTGSQNLLPLATLIGAKLVLMYKWDVKKAVEIVKKEKITHAGGVPFIVRTLIDAGLTEKDCSLEAMSFGGAPSASTLVQDGNKAFPKAVFAQAYGMTENFTVGVSQCDEDFSRKPASTGVAVPVCGLLIMDSDGQEVPRGGVGEVWLRSPSTAKGYWRQPDATAASWTPEGWFKSGDLGYMDEDDFLFISDRLKDIIIRAGENIPSIDVENAILKDPRLSEVCCVSILHPSLGEEVATVVVPKPGHKVTEESVHAFAATVLRPMWRPRFILVQREEIIKNANGKHDKKLVRTDVRREWDERRTSNPKL